MRLGQYEARAAKTAAERRQWLQLRSRIFRGGTCEDGDSHDAEAMHILLLKEGMLCGGYRVRLHENPAHDLSTSYTGAFYDLSQMSHYPRPILELGRFCIAPEHRDPHLLRLAWAKLARLIDDTGAGLLLGCASFQGAKPSPHAKALAALIPHIGQSPLCPLPHPAQRHIALSDFAKHDPHAPDLPQLLRSYLMLGAWVGDHAVIDSDLDTLHVLTCVEIDRIPPAKARFLRGITPQNMG